MNTFPHFIFPKQNPPLIIIITIFSLFITSTLSRHVTPPSSLYSQQCPNIPSSQSTQSTHPFFTSQLPSFYSSYVINGHQFFNGPTSQITANLIPQNAFKTSINGLFKFQATLSLRSNKWAHFNKNRFLLSVHGGPRFHGFLRGLRFQLSGFWDSSNGYLCLVGSGSRKVIGGNNNNDNNLIYNVVFKSNYPNVTVIDTSLVVGSLESIDFEDGSSFFKPVYVMSFAKSYYEYTLIKNEIVDHVGNDKDGNFGVLSRGRFANCYQFANLEDYFELGYKRSCEGLNCSWLYGVFGFSPRFMSLNEIDCSDKRVVRVSFGFSNVSDVRNGFRQPLEPRKTLVAEGAWNLERSRVSFVACRILNLTTNPLNASVGDCSIRLNFTFANTLSIRESSVISGLIWSTKSEGESGYFDKIEIRASGSRRAALPDMKYKYTEVDNAKKFCVENKGSKVKGKIYPDPYSHDMKFDMEVKNSQGKKAWGKAYPVFVGDHFVQDIYPFINSRLLPVSNSSLYHGSINVAYRLTFSPVSQFKVGGRSFFTNETIRISAEGVYDTETGHLCMIGCLSLKDNITAPLNASKLDCDIFIDVHFPSRGSSDKVKGSIESKHENSHPLYFDHLDISSTSLTVVQIDSVTWRMDFEITMVLISNTLTCIFVGLQLFHVKRNPNVLPYISIVMLVIVTLGHMIPLLLNMEALFLSSPSKKTVLFESGGWLEVNEVLVRVITMVAFLLEFRLLQLTWSSRGTENNNNINNDSQKTLQESEKKVVYYSLPIYAFGALIAWIIQLIRGSPSIAINSSGPSIPFWRDMKSYAGFILDAFLLPQIIFNIFSDSKEKSLAIPYYFGTTIVRLLPHVYDLFRAHSSGWMDPWYIYADPRMNFYSTTWDILVSLLGLFFVVLVFLQQWFGGKWVVPRRFNKNVEYEKVPVGL